jgi:hypothetical protein
LSVTVEVRRLVTALEKRDIFIVAKLLLFPCSKAQLPAGEVHHKASLLVERVRYQGLDAPCI